ncbi:PTS sugar transporter subunit IIA [Enterococcus olivae]
MSELGKMINPENIIFLSSDTKIKEEALDSVSSLMLKNGYVKESYIEAIKEREHTFPTGLNTTSYGIAIPHVDSKHVNEATIAVGILKEPVEFQEMGAEDIIVPVRIIFMLAIKDPSKQLDVLQAVISLIENGTKIDELVQATDATDVLQILN